MSHPEIDDTCDKCGSAIVTDTHARRPTAFHFIVSRRVPDEERATDDDETLMDGVLYQEEARVLCKKCELKLLWWIDEDDASEALDVDLPPRIETAQHIRAMASELDGLADELETGLDDLASTEREDTSE